MSDSESDFTEHTLSSRTVYRGRILHLVEDEVRMPDGKSARREYVRHPGAVAMLPMLDRETVVLIRQYRYPLRRHFYEIPAGKIDPGEEPFATAQRELREETGYTAASWRSLAVLDPCIGYSDERIELFLAQELTRVGSALDEGEFLEEVVLRVPVALEWVKTGRITDVKTIVGLLWVANLL